MKQYDCMFIQVNETGYIYHLCYTDNTREVITRARFMELVSQTKYEDDDGVYWFYSNKSGLAVPPQEMPMNIQVLGKDSRGYFYHTGEKSARNVAISRDEYERILVTAVSQKVEYRRHSWQSVYTIHFDNGFDYQTPHNAPKTHETRRAVVHHVDGYVETDAQWLARQEQLDYDATMDAASYRQGV